MIVILCIPLVTVFSQTAPVVASYLLISADSTDTITRTVNDLIFSFIREQRNYRIMDMRTEPLPDDLSVPSGADYIFYGAIGKQPDGIKLELILRGGPYGITRMISRVFENSNRILLESRLLVRDLFDQSIALPDPLQLEKYSEPPKKQTNPINSGTTPLSVIGNVDSLAGTWYGESSIEKVLILRGGRGVAILTTGISIPLELVPLQDVLSIRQKGPSNIRQFSNLPDPVAQQAVSVTPPLEWRFQISSDTKQLIGIAYSVKIIHDGNNIVSMEKQETQVIWHRN